MAIRNNRKRRVTIISRESNRPTLDIELLEKELTDRGIEVETLTRLLRKEKSLKSLGYIGHMFRQEACILRSRVVVMDTYCIVNSMLPHRKSVKTLQIWHALSAVKKFGWQTVGLEDGSSEKTARLMRMHKGYDYVACASDITAEHFCEAFRVPREKIVKLGLPRIDYIRRKTTGSEAEEAAAAVRDRYPLLKRPGTKTILYAPTFHKGKPADVRGLAEALDPERYNLIVKLHPIDRATGEKVEADNIIYDTEFRSYDILPAADIVISDYSSLVVEATLADKPLYIYAYDIDSYRRTTGLNLDFAQEPIAEYVYTDARGLAEGLEKPYDISRLRAFRDRYIDIDTENCTRDLADFIESMMQ